MRKSYKIYEHRISHTQIIHNHTTHIQNHMTEPYTNHVNDIYTLMKIITPDNKSYKIKRQTYKSMTIIQTSCENDIKIYMNIVQT